MDKLTLVELIEVETAKLSPEARELWEEYNASLYSSPDEETRLKPHEIELMRRIHSLPESDSAVIDRVRELWIGLYNSNAAESKGHSGEVHRVRAVILAANRKDLQQGRQVDPDMSVDQAIARLKEPG